VTTLLRTAVSGVVVGLVFAATVIISRLVLQPLGLGLPRAPAQAPEDVAGYYLVAGSIGLAAGTVWLVQGLEASTLRRWSVTFAFVFVGFALSTTLEAGIYSAADGVVLTVLLFLLPCLALSIVQVMISRIDKTPSPGPAALGRGSHRRDLAWRLGAAVLAFPVIYFVFGIIASPIVAGYYTEGVAGLVLPSTVLIVGTQIFRGVLHVAIILLVMQIWGRSRRQLVIALTASFFVFVTMYDVVLAYEMPIVLTVTHAVEVLADSFVFSWIVVVLLEPLVISLDGSRSLPNKR